MLRTRWLRAGLLLVLVGLATPVQAQDSPLAQVPAESAIVLQVRGLEQTKDRLVTMIKNAIPDVGPALEARLNEGLKSALEGRSLKGLAPAGPVFFVMTSLPQGGGQPPGGIFVKVTSYTEFRDNILTADEKKSVKKEGSYEVATVAGQDIYMVDKKGFVALTPVKDAAEQFAKTQPGLDGKINKALASRLLGSDIALYVNMTSINKVYGGQMQLGQMMLDGMLQQGQLPGGMNAEAFKKVVAALFQIIKDSQAFLLAVEFRPEGLALNIQDQVSAESSSGQFLKDAKPTALKDLGGMVAGQTGYTATSLNAKLLKPLQGMLLGVQATENKEVQQALDQFVAAGPKESLNSFNIPLSGLQVTTFADPAKGVEATINLLKALKEGETFGNAPLKGKPELKVNAEKHRGFTLNKFSASWDIDKVVEQSLQGNPLAANMKDKMTEMMKKMLGEGINQWFGTDGKVVVQITAKDAASAKAMLDQYLDKKNPLSAQQAYQSVRQQLPADTTLVGLMDAASYFGMIAETMQTTLGGMVPLPPTFPGQAPKGGPYYLSIAVTLQPQTGSFDLYVPGGAANTLHKMFIEPFTKQGGQ